MKPGRVWPGVGVGAVVSLHELSRSSLLMLVRAGAHGAGLWSVPGGWVEMGEDPMRAAEREVWEETGLRVRATRPDGWTSHLHREPDRETIHAVTLWVRCAYVDDPRNVTVTEPEKCPEVAWVDYRDIRLRPLFQPFDSWWKP